MTDTVSARSGSPTWLTTTWTHDDGRDGYAEPDPYYIGFDSDGTFVWQDGADEIDGTYKFHNDVLLMSTSDATQFGNIALIPSNAQTLREHFVLDALLGGQAGE